MIKQFTSLGLMSGTSGDGVDASVILSDGNNDYELILDRYYEYDLKLSSEIHNITDTINNVNDLIKNKKRIQDLERKITIFHAEISKKIILDTPQIDIVGLHGQTIFHNSNLKVSKQLGNGKLLSQLINKNLVFNFRSNDLKNNGEGAPLTPIYHKLIKLKKNISNPVSFLNIGGIANITYFDEKNVMHSQDIGPGNCLIDKWIRINSTKKYDDKGIIASRGKVNEIILENAIENFNNSKLDNNRSYDIKDFDLSFARGLSLEDGAATLTEFTVNILSQKIKDYSTFLCGGGRKNNFLIKRLYEKSNVIFKNIDDLEINGDFVESQAFAYLAIRSFLNLPISFPETTGCSKPCTGGEMIII